MVGFDEVVHFLYQPKDPASLGVIRVLFGLLMLSDLAEERGGSEIDVRWGDPKDCHFPLFNFMKPPRYQWITMLYLSMFFGAIGIMLGFKFRFSTLLFGVPYWYILLLDKSYWNNHSYLYGIVTILLAGSCANRFCSIDQLLEKEKAIKTIPNWNYFILKVQFFMLYFFAGLKKADAEWLSGYSMAKLGEHWVFRIFTIVLTVDQIDYLLIHWFGFLLDLTVGFFMIVKTTRPFAMLFCASFHLMNSRLFSIGMFPYVCLATMPLFCEENWPRKLVNFLTRKKFLETDFKPKLKNEKITWKMRFVTTLLLTHCGLQTFLPYSHFITKGYNNWTNGLYGYSWDMMIHSWNTILVVIKVVDNQTGEESFIDSEAFTFNDRWTKHADMTLQYANCLNNNLNEGNFRNLSIYLDVWCSLNGRFQQRMYNPNYDLLKAKWSPFQSVEWLLPLLTEYNDLRAKLVELSTEIHSWSNETDVLFIADYPGLFLENFINEDFENVTLTVLQGQIIFELVEEEQMQSIGGKLSKGDSIEVEVGLFHRIHTIGEVPSCYMYTFSESKTESNEETVGIVKRSYSPFPFVEDVSVRTVSFVKMLSNFWMGLESLMWGTQIVLSN